MKSELEKLLAHAVRPRSQRIQIVLSFLLSALLLASFFFQSFAEQQRTLIPQLDSKNLSYCLLSECPEIQELGNLKVSNVEIVEAEYSTFVVVDFVNSGRLSGSREFWLELRNPQGQIAEAAKAKLDLQLKNPVRATFSFQRTPEVLLSGELRLAY